MKLNLKSKIIPLSIIASITAFMLMYAKDGHNNINISAIKGSLKDINGIYAELEEIGRKSTKTNYKIDKNGVSSKIQLAKKSSELHDSQLTKVGKDLDDMISYIGIYTPWMSQEEISNPKDSTVSLLILKAKNKKYIPEKDLNVLESENKTSFEEIDSTKFEKIKIPLKRNTKVNPNNENSDFEFSPILDYVYRKDGNIYAFLSYTLDDGSHQFEVLKINPENLSVTCENKFNYKGKKQEGLVIYDTFIKNGNLIYVAEDYIPEKANEENLLFIKYNIDKKGYTTHYQNGLNLGDIFSYHLDGDSLSFRSVKTSKNGKILDKYLINTFELNSKNMQIENIKDFKTDLKVSEYSFPFHTTYVDDKRVAYIASEYYVKTSKDDDVYGVSAPSVFKVLDKNTGDLEFEGRITSNGANYTENSNIILKGDEANE